jgi:hypothetical protein
MDSLTTIGCIVVGNVVVEASGVSSKTPIAHRMVIADVGFGMRNHFQILPDSRR